MADAPPELHQVLGAGFVASLAAVAPFAAIGVASFAQSPSLAGAAFLLSLIYALPIALLHTFLLGLPLYSLLRWRWRLTAPRAALGGFAVGSAPAAALSLAFDASGQAMPAVVLSAGSPGAIGGLAFWAMLRPRKSEMGGPFPDRPFDVAPEVAD